MPNPIPPSPCSDPIPLGVNHDRNARRTLWVIILTVAMMAVEIGAGYYTGSMALLADGFHMATDAGALGITAIAYAYAKRHAVSGKYSFGSGKIGDLAGFASALILGVVAVGIGVESMMRLLHPQPIAFGDAALVATLGLFVNLASAVLLSGGHHHASDHDHHHAAHAHTHGHDNNIRAAYAHVLADTLTSILAIAALLAGRYLGFAWLDPVTGIIGALVIARWSWTLIGDTAGILLDRSDAGLQRRLNDAVAGSGDVVIDDLHVWPIGGGRSAAIVTVRQGPGLSAADVRARASGVAGICHLTIECRDAGAPPA